MEFEKDIYNCMYRELRIVWYILVGCPLLYVQIQGLKRVSPEMDLPTLLSSVTGLQEVVKYITTQGD